MQIAEIKNIIKTRKGQNLSAVIGKPMKTRKGVNDTVEKVTRLVIRGGVEYDNIKAIQEKRESGELPAKNAGLPWGQWAEFPLHITHKGTDYARFYAASGIEFTPKTEYYLNGELTTKDIIEPLCLASEFPKKGEERPDCFTIKAENVKAILI